MEKVALVNLRKEIENLRKKIFIYETLQSEKEIKEKKVRGPFKSGKDVFKKLNEI